MAHLPSRKAQASTVPSRNSGVLVRRGLAVAGMVLVSTVSVLGAVEPALADGPGYGGTADKLSVAWTNAPLTAAAGTKQQAVERTLQVGGVGFRNLSQVTVRVSTSSTIKANVDAAGTLSFAVHVPANGPDLTGTSVVAAGIAPSGTALTLVGSVPPVPTGMSPATVVPWVAALLCVVLLGVRVARAKSRRNVKTTHHAADFVHHVAADIHEHSHELVEVLLGPVHMPDAAPATG